MPTTPHPDLRPVTGTLQRLADLAADLLGADAGHVWAEGDLTVEPEAATNCREVLSTGRPVVMPTFLGVPVPRAGEAAIDVLFVRCDRPAEWTDTQAQGLARVAALLSAELDLDRRREDHETDRIGWQLAVDAAEVGAWRWELGTNTLEWDDRLLAIFGSDAEHFGGTIEAFGEFVHVDDRDRVNAALDEAIASRGVFASEYRVVRPDGEVVWVRARGRALAGPDGVATHVVGAAYDTTAEQDAEARVARLMEAMPAAFIHLDRDWRFTYVNAEALRLFHPGRTSLLGRSLWEAFPDTVGSPFERHYREAVDSGEPVTFDTYVEAPIDRHLEVRAWPSPDGLSIYFVDVTERLEVAGLLARNAERTAFLGEVARSLGDTLDVEDGAHRVAEVVVPTLADWSVVTLSTTSPDSPHAVPWRRSLRDVAAWAADPDQRGPVERYRELRIDSLTDDSLLARAFTTGEATIVQTGAAAAVAGVLEPGEARDLSVSLDAEAVAIVPLRARGRTVGLLSLFRNQGQGPFEPELLRTVAEVAERAALSIDNARLYAAQRELAETLQRSMLTSPPVSDRIEVAVRYEPAAEAAQVGGDWYDAFVQSDGATVIAIGDVVGHDTAAAAAMSQVRSLLRGIAVHSDDGPADVLRGVDRAMLRLDVETTATAVVARFEPIGDDPHGPIGQVRWSNAGHPPPMIVVGGGRARQPGEDRSWRLGDRPDDAVDALWENRFDLLLGLDPETPRTETVVTLRPGATVWLYTDGLIERRGQGLDEGLAQMRAVLEDLEAEGLGLEESCAQLLARMLPERPEDDVALVAVRLPPAAS